MRPVSKSEFARERGVHPSRVSQWLKDGRIVELADGKIDADAAHEALNARLDQAKGIRREGNITSAAPASATAASVAPGETPSLPLSEPAAEPSRPPAAASKPSGSNDDYWAHKTESQKWEAVQRKTKALQEAGALMSADEVDTELVNAASEVRNGLTAMIDRLASVLDPASPARAHKLLTTEVQKVLHEFQRRLEDRARGASPVPGERAPALQ